MGESSNEIELKSIGSSNSNVQHDIDDNNYRHSNFRSLTKQIILSITVIVAVAICWTGGTQFSKSALIIDPKHFYAPYTMTWFNTNFMILCYPVYLIYILITHNKDIEYLKSCHNEALRIYQVYTNKPKFIQYLLFTAMFLGFWIGANYCYSMSLVYVPASITTSISAANTAIVLVLSWIILKDKFNIYQIISIACAVSGVVIISLDKSTTSQSSVWKHFLGILLAILSAAFSATYKVLFKRIIGNANLGQVSMFMTGLGFMNLVINIFPCIFLIIYNKETIEFDYVPWFPITGSSLLSLLFNFLINFGIALLHPLVISIGMLMGIPLNIIIDIIFRHLKVEKDFLIGGFLVLLSFVLIVFPLDIFMKDYFKKCKNSINKKA
uniref:EamA domain-containing protein n=1 Tax=Strongyloides venezuelensis TaxID=75913 RepID=A0A0K0F0G7_STRVS